ncbi:MAG: molybdopterin-dependent oxidoreductase [Chloroflexota bacterium]|nr:molybdopterin-dependent oxidoreductase [Chloroflexota bacterium]
MAFPQVQQETTLMCISNEVPGGLMSNAVWQGVPLATLLEAAGPQARVVEVLLHAADGYTDTIPFAKALDPTTLLVYAMNGEPLPDRHGYPARLLVPGLYGEKSVKWITRVELVNQDVKGFYERQGWGPNFTIRPRARIDQPVGDLVIAAGSTSVPIKGVAFGGNRGVARVDVSLDDGQSWQLATLDSATSPLAWVFWSYAWSAPGPDTYIIVARATDGDGLLQTATVHGTAPEGATGYHRIMVQVRYTFDGHKLRICHAEPERSISRS